MKRVAPASIIGRFFYNIFQHRFQLSFVLLVVFIALLIYAIFAYISRVTPRLMTQKYLVAASDIAAGAEIKKNNVAAVAFVDDYTPRNAINEEELDQVVGMYALFPFMRGDVLTPFELAQTAQGGSMKLSSRLPSGTKLYYLKKQDVHTPPPGLSLYDRIDIYTGSEASASATLSSLEVIDLSESQAEGDFYIGLAISEGQIGALTQLLLKKIPLQIAILPKTSDEDTRLVK